MFVSNNSLLSGFPDTAAVCFYLESLVESPVGGGYGPEGNEWDAAHLRKPMVLSPLCYIRAYGTKWT